MTTEAGSAKLVKPHFFYSVIFLMLIFCVGRMYHAYINNISIDFTLFFSCTYAAMQGRDFFDVKNLIFYDWQESLMVMPGLLIFYIPYMYLDIYTARLVYFLLSLGFSIFAYIWIYRLCGLYKKVDFRSPNLNTLLFFAGGFIFLNSSPQLMCQRNGQVSIWVLVLVLLFFSAKNKYLRAFLFGLMAVFKYSMITFFAPLLFFKKQYFICFAAFAVFLLICVWPALVGYNLVDMYLRYIDVISNTINGGCNSYMLAGHDMLQFGYFRMTAVNLTGKAIFAVIMLLVLWREQDKKGIGLNLMMLTFCFTMLVSYHRLYDNVVLILLLLVKTNFLILKKDKLNAVICGIFLLYYLIPISWIFELANYLGSTWLSGVFYVSAYEEYPTVLPVIAWSQTLLGLYLLYLYFKTDDDYTFKLETGTVQD